jgi:hypothetical protein
MAAFPPNKLFKISDAAGGSPTTEEIEVPGGKLMKDMLDSNDNFIVVSQVSLLLLFFHLSLHIYLYFHSWRTIY